MVTSPSIPEILDSAAELLAAEHSASLTAAFLRAADWSYPAAADAQRALVDHLGLQAAGNVAAEILGDWVTRADGDLARITAAMRDAAGALRNGGA
jgi:hypothetical protein